MEQENVLVIGQCWIGYVVFVVVLGTGYCMIVQEFGYDWIWHVLMCLGLDTVYFMSMQKCDWEIGRAHV